MLILAFNYISVKPWFSIFTFDPATQWHMIITFETAVKFVLSFSYLFIGKFKQKYHLNYHDFTRTGLYVKSKYEMMLTNQAKY